MFDDLTFHVRLFQTDGAAQEKRSLTKQVRAAQREDKQRMYQKNAIKGR